MSQNGEESTIDESKGVLFPATFDDGFRYKVSADIDPDANIMDTDLLDKQFLANVQLVQSGFKKPAVYDMVATGIDRNSAMINVNALLT